MQIFRPYKLHSPWDDMPLLQGINRKLTYIDPVSFQRKQEVLRSLTHGKQHCTAERAFIIRCLHCLLGLPCPLPVLPGYTLSIYITWCSTKPFGKSDQPGFCRSLYTYP